MIEVTMRAGDGERFLVRFQTKTLSGDGSIVWADSEVTLEVGQSQRYGLSEDFRLIVEVDPAPENGNG